MNIILLIIAVLLLVAIGIIFVFLSSQRKIAPSQEKYPKGHWIGIGIALGIGIGMPIGLILALNLHLKLLMSNLV